MFIRPWRLHKTLIAGIGWFVFPLGGTPASQTDRLYIDVHMHLDGVAKEGMGRQASGQRSREPEDRRAERSGSRSPQRQLPGKSSPGPKARDYLPAADALVRVMDEYGVAKAIIMPPPQLPDTHGAYDYTDLLLAVKAHPDRLALGAGGGTLNPMIAGIEPSKVTDDIRRRFEDEATGLVQAGAKAFGEMTAMHLCMNPLHHYIASAPDHPLFLLLADIAARHNVPIDLHMEAIEKNLPTPAPLARACDQNPDIIPGTLSGFERLLAHNRRATIVWQHIGWDNTGQMTPHLIQQLMNTHSNLYVALKAVPIEKGHTRPNRIHDDGWQILPEWLALFRQFPDRFVVGADEFINVGGGGYKKPPFFKETWKTLQSLPPDLLRKLGRDNAARIYRL